MPDHIQLAGAFSLVINGREVRGGELHLEGSPARVLVKVGQRLARMLAEHTEAVPARSPRRGRTLVLVGGLLNAAAGYRQVAAKRGWHLVHHDEVKPACPLAERKRVAAVVVMTGHASGPLLAEANAFIARCNPAPKVCWLPSSSKRALADALQKFDDEVSHE